MSDGLCGLYCDRPCKLHKERPLKQTGKGHTFLRNDLLDFRAHKLAQLKRLKAAS